MACSLDRFAITGHSARCVSVAEPLDEARKEWMEIDVSRYQGRVLKQWEIELERENHDRRALRAAFRYMARDRAAKRKVIKEQEKRRLAGIVKPVKTYGAVFLFGFADCGVGWTPYSLCFPSFPLLSKFIDHLLFSAWRVIAQTPR